jgi:hypothetical protein
LRRQETPDRDGGADDAGCKFSRTSSMIWPAGLPWQGGITEDGGIVDPSDEMTGGLRAVRCILGDRLVARVADHSDKTGCQRMLGHPRERSGVDLDSDDCTAIAQQLLDDRTANASASPGDDK